jgi:uncharacterized Zn finger protein
VSGELLNGGDPIVVTTPRDRIGHGPWARLFVTTVIPNEGSSVAERGRALARGGNVHSVSISSGTISARVVGNGERECTVTFTADPVPPRVWAAVTLSARRNERLAAAMAGREQSLHLEHVMRFDWDEPLIPNGDGLTQCTCDSDAVCEHIAGLTYVVADLIDGDPSLLLRWRGCNAVEAVEVPAKPEIVQPIRSDIGAWQAGPLPELRRLRPLPAGAVLMCLGPSDLRAGGEDLAVLLRRAYASFFASEPHRVVGSSG